MNARQLPRWTRAPSMRTAFRVLACTVLAAVLLGAPLIAAAEEGRPGATNPASDWAEWPDDELFAFYHTGAGSGLGAGVDAAGYWDPSADLTQLPVAPGQTPWTPGVTYGKFAADSGHILSTDYDTVAFAFPETGAGHLEVYTYPPTVASKVSAITDLANTRPDGVNEKFQFFDLKVGDLDGIPNAEGNYLEEVVYAYAQPGTGNKLPVKLAVANFGLAAATPPYHIVSATSSTTVDGASLLSGAIKNLYNDDMLALAAGDFDGNGVEEIALGYLSGSNTLTVDIFRYTVPLDTHGAPVLPPTLQRVGTSTISATPAGAVWNETISLAAGDFDGNGRAELIVGTIADHPYATSWSDTRRETYLHVLRITCTDGALCATNPNVTVSVAKESQVWEADEGYASEYRPWRIQLAAGLFKYDPANGWDLNRRQLLVAYSYTLNYFGTDYNQVWLFDYIFDTALAPTMTGIDSMLTNIRSPYWSLTAGGFQGDRSSEDPRWSWALAAWQPTMTAPVAKAAGMEIVLGNVNADFSDSTEHYFFLERTNAYATRLPVLAVDRDGDSVYLGAPVHMVVEQFIDTDVIVEEPPKHAYWDPALKRVVNVSRFDGFNTALSLSSTDRLESTSKDTSSESYGTSQSYSASETLETHGHGFLFIPSLSASETASLQHTTSHDYEESSSSFYSSAVARTIDSSASTAKDDYLKGRFQLLDVWRYRVYGADDQSGRNVFYDMILPAPAEEIPFSKAGVDAEWYQPLHENGNVLSYPLLAAIRSPTDLGTYRIPCPASTDTACKPCTVGTDAACNTWGTKTITALMIKPEQKSWDGNPETLTYKFSTESGAGSERAYTEKLAENDSVSASATIKSSWGTKALGTSFSLSGSAQFSRRNSSSWGSSATAQAKTSQSTGITVNKPSSDTAKHYAFYTTAYLTADGTIRVAYAVDLSETASDVWWSTTYAQNDLALNLPKHFYYMGNVVTPHWQPRSDVTRREAKNILFYEGEPDIVSGENALLAGAALEGQTVKVEARVYNYSVRSTVPSGAKVCFDTVPLDPVNLTEIKAERTRIHNGCTTVLVPLPPQQSALVSILWDTSGAIGSTTNTRDFHVYAVLDPDNAVAEKYEMESKATQFYWTEDRQMNDGGYWTSCAALSDTDYADKTCVDPAQNNEGYARITVTKALAGDPLWAHPAADVSLPEGAFVALDEAGEVSAGPVEVYTGAPLRLRVAVHTDTPGSDFSYVAIFDGKPNEGGTLIGAQRVFVGDPLRDSAALFEWTPMDMGPHTLHARVFQRVSDPVRDNNAAQLAVNVNASFVGFLPVVQQQ